MITRVQLDYGHGWIGEEFDSGVSDEVYLISRWGGILEEKLREIGTPLEVMPSRRRPGWTHEQRSNGGGKTDLVIHMHMGVANRRGMLKQMGQVYVASGFAHMSLAHAVCDSLDAWIRQSGICDANPSKVKEAKMPWFSENSIQIEPFFLNSVGAEVLCRRMGVMSNLLAMVISDWCCAQNRAMRRVFHRAALPYG